MATYIQLGLAREVGSELEKAQKELVISEQQVLELAKQERAKWQGQMNDLDLIACMVLATAWSGQNKQAKQAQFDITKQTVGVICLKGTLYLACDGLTWKDFKPDVTDKNLKFAGPNAALYPPKWTEKQKDSYTTSKDPGDSSKRIADPSYEIDNGRLKFLTQQAVQHSLRVHGEKRPVVFIDSDGPGHSEMRLLEFMADNGRPDGDLVGVSKPCCENCKGQLEKYGIKFSCWHNFKVGNWTPPTKGPSMGLV